MAGWRGGGGDDLTTTGAAGGSGVEEKRDIGTEGGGENVEFGSGKGEIELTVEGEESGGGVR